MTSRILSVLTIALFCGNIALAQQEESINLEVAVTEECKSNLGYSLVDFKLLQPSDNSSKIEISIENLQPGETLMLFPAAKTEKELKKLTPKVVFDKAFGGDKGKRSVSGCSGIPYAEQIAPSQKTKFSITVENETAQELTIPFYFVKTDNALLRGKRVTILREETVKYRITVRAWNESNEQFAALKDSVNQFVSSLKSVRFCKHKRHAESVETQQQPYKARMERLKEQIDNIRRNWTSDQTPHKAYSRLIEELGKINLDDYNIGNCRRHGNSKAHSCSYCSLSAEQVYHQLDDLYQSMYVGRVSKADASRKASALYQCYQKSRKRKKSSSFANGIACLYNRIVNK